MRVAATTSDTFPVLGNKGAPIFVGVRNLPLKELTSFMNFIYGDKGAVGGMHKNAQTIASKKGKDELDKSTFCP